MLFQNILVPYDGSKFANRAFKIALNLGKKYSAKITILTVLNTPMTGSWYVDNRIADADLKRQLKIIQGQFKKFGESAKKSNVKFNSKIIYPQNVGKAIVSYAKSSKMDLVVMGSHGKTNWDKLILGSVANGVSNRVHCPVLIVK
ncbi:universal stress protein [Nitrosopumilus sp. b1]|uniref:universal stress protein n=1 Tax=Nitrosopumilus sp. b1 TaxID=2109907 RepID=UPI0015F5430F|nr:universal stress protein [Nitrosopumilus sp. b1]KAF6243455.1 universal stress protein [Nitrosopumilus sp. b1]